MKNIMISDNLRNPHNSTLPKTVRALPNIVRFQNQGNAIYGYLESINNK